MRPESRQQIDAKCPRCDARTCKCPAPPLSKHDKLADAEDAAADAAADEWERQQRRRHSGDSSIRCEICAPLRCVKAKT